MKITKFLLFGFTMVFSITLNAQPPGDDNGGTKPGSVPITGIEYLIGLGGLFGIWKIMSFSKKKESIK